jgi:NADH-quinone oxidoreductase subunit L
MWVPLVILSVGAATVGAIVEPLTHALPDYLERVPALVLADKTFHETSRLTIQDHHFDWTLAIISTLVAGTGVALAAGLYRKGGPEVVAPWLKSVHALSLNKVHVDEVYQTTLVTPLEGMATASRQFDSFLDAFARLVSFVPRFLAALLRPLQNGLVQFYALGMVLGLGVFITVILFRSAR